jgi:hypothetical protein
MESLAGVTSVNNAVLEGTCAYALLNMVTPQKPHEPAQQTVPPWQGRFPRHIVSAVAVVHYLSRRCDARIANINLWAGNQLRHLGFIFAAERAMK